MLSPLALTLTLTLALPASEVARTEGAHTAVLVHHSDEYWSRVLGEQVLPYLEEAWTQARALGDIEPGEDDLRAEIHIYRRPADFTRPGARALVAVEGVDDLRFDLEGRVAHLTLEPRCSAELLKGIGLPPTTRRAAARAAAILALRCSYAEDHTPPAWWVAGASAWIAQRVLEGGGESGPALAEPWVAGRLIRAAAALAPIEDVDLLALVGGDALDPPSRDALGEALFHYLWSRPQGDAPEALAAPAPYAPEAWLAALTPSASGERGPTTGSGLQAWLADYAPPWREERGFMSRSGDSWLQVAAPKSDALCWAPPVGCGEYSIRGRFTLLPGRRHANIAVGRLDGGYIVLNITSDDGAYCFSYDATSDKWENQRYAPSPAVPLGAEVTFGVLVIDERVELHVNGLRLFAVSVQGRDMSGSWGLGAPGGAAVRWHDVVVE